MIKCFEANYPESLGAVLVHRAPWLFSSIWKIIKGWLDPVVASKIHFTNNIDDLSKFVEKSKIIKELGGPVDFEFKYTEPSEDENKRMADTETREKIQATRMGLVNQFEQKTMEWIDAYDKSSSAPEEDKSRIVKERNLLAAELRDNYWELDPYVRARSLYDRTGLLKDFVGDPEEDDDNEGFTTAPATPLKASMDVRRSVDLRKSMEVSKVNGNPS